MKSFWIIIFAILLAWPVQAATEEESVTVPNSAQEKKTPEKDSAQAPAKKEVPGEYVCKYFTVRLPDDWKAYLPPTEQQGMLSALFGKDNQSSTVALTITPHGGIDLMEVAEMFAQQFKAQKPPVEKNGQYVFNITRNELPGKVWVSCQGPLVMVTAISGNQKEGLNFIKNNISTENYKDLFPR